VKIASVLLAAGAGTRFLASLAEESTLAESAGPAHKLLARLGEGATVVEHAYRAMKHGTPAGDPLLVVTGAVVLPKLEGATILDNERWNEGQASSLWTAIDYAETLNCDAVVVGLGDSPGITATDWANVRRALENGAAMAVATFAGERRNPVGLARDVWPLVSRLGDEGARTVLRRNPERVTEVPCVGNSADIDTVEDLRTWP
jgi:CTP:molybdopterin cytidylyltransferase MocA